MIEGVGLSVPTFGVTTLFQGFGVVGFWLVVVRHSIYDEEVFSPICVRQTFIPLYRANSLFILRSGILRFGWNHSFRFEKALGFQYSLTPDTTILFQTALS